jgi:hypothetical protein
MVTAHARSAPPTCAGCLVGVIRKRPNWRSASRFSASAMRS